MTATTPSAVDRLRWMLDRLGDPTGLELADLESVYDTSGWTGNWTIVDELRRLRGDHPIALPFIVESLVASTDESADAVVVAADEKRWALTCWVPAGDGRIDGCRIVQAPPQGTVVRDATSEDAAVLADLERRSPLRLGDRRMTFDRGEDYFASARLMEEVTIYVAEVDGVIAGVYWGAQQPVLVDGRPRLLFLEHHVRIDPETRRGGVFWALVVYGRDTYARSADTIAFYVSPDNAAVRKFVEGTPSWSVQPTRVLIDCRQGAGQQPRPRATPADAEEIVEILNAAHDREELFVPYTVDSLRSRLERAPDQYGWSSIRLRDGAVVGVGESGVQVTISDEAGTEPEVTCRSLVLDHGFRDGSERAYVDLLRDTAAELAGEGRTHLAAFTCANTRTHDPLRSLADRSEPFDFWAFAIEEPPGLATRGHYVDPIYF
jgi:hypothetical protein